jgi:hypothetical protein
MSAVYSYGVKAVKASAIAAETGLPVELVDVGEIYRDTPEFTQDDPTVTEHYSELKDDPIITRQRKGAKNLVFSLMDTSAVNCVKWMGGTVTEVAEQPDTWNEPADAVEIEMALEITMEDDSVYGIRRGKVMAKLIPDPKKTGITLIQVQVRPQAPLVDGLTATYKKDPA